jgi:hypothetical protein
MRACASQIRAAPDRGGLCPMRRGVVIVMMHVAEVGQEARFVDVRI